MSDAPPADDVPKKRKRVSKPLTSIPTPKPKPKAAQEHEFRAWMCVDHPVLYGGRPGAVMFARSEEDARAKLLEHLDKRGVKETHEFTLEPLKEGAVFLFQ